MSNIGGGEILVVLLLALLVLGPERLPKAARQVGNFVRQVRQMSSGFQDELRSVIDVADRPFTPEESHIRPVPAIGDRSSSVDTDPAIDVEALDGELEADIRARHDVDGRRDPAPTPDDPLVPPAEASPDERAAG